MKKITSNLFIFLATAFAFSYFTNASAATCSSISRSTFGANTVLTSSELNNQFSTVYSAANNLDAGCLTDGTLEAAALNATDFQPLLNNTVAGCKITKSSDSTISISPCSMTINGNMVNKTGASTVAFGCTGCYVELVNRAYYVYIKGDSTGTTINSYMTITAPNSLGYNGTDKVVGRFWNNNSSNIDEYSIDQWSVNQFIPQETGRVNLGNLVITATGTDPTNGTIVKDVHYFTRQGPYALMQFNYQRSATGAVAGTGYYTFTLPDGLNFEDEDYSSASSYPDASFPATAYGPIMVIGNNGGWPQNGTAYIVPYSSTTFRLFIHASINLNGFAVSTWSGIYMQNGFNDVTSNLTIKGSVLIPIKNWDY
jgi:hypothetical protein